MEQRHVYHLSGIGRHLQVNQRTEAVESLENETFVRHHIVTTSMAKDELQVDR